MLMKWFSAIPAILILSSPVLAQTWTEFAVGPNFTYPAAVNNSGQIIGSYSATAAGKSKTFVRNPDGSIIKFQSDAESSGGVSINNSGEAVGYLESSGFSRSPDGSFHKISLSCCATSAVAVNDAGHIAGTFFLDWERKIRAVYLMDGAGKYIQFTFPHGYPPHDSVLIEVNGLNNSDQIVGDWTSSSNGVSGQHGFLYESGTFTQLDFSGAKLTRPRAISNRGEVVGDWTDTAGAIHGFVWTDTQGFTSFDAPQGTLTSITAINSSGVSVGYYSDGEKDHGFVLDPQLAITILDAPNASGTIPTGINASGQVAGIYIGPKFSQKGFLYTPAILPPH
jgi:probable HAF family extracellular repeat protein